MALLPLHTRGRWSNRLGFILATTGAAVGLGNIWKFPYMAGDNGGSAFVLVYLLCVLLIGLPLMLAEMLIGRRGQQNPVSTLKTLAKEANASPFWQLVGWGGAVTLLLTLSFYSVVAGWTVAYLFRAWGGLFNGLNAAQVGALWQQFLNDPYQLLVWHAVFMILTLWVVTKGVQAGLEKAARIMMPMLFVILIILDGYSTATPGFMQGIKFLFAPDFHKITATVALSAMGHAFFTLAIGAGCILVYGSYLDKNIRLGSAVLTIAGLDVLVALLAGIAIFPLIFTYHLTPAGGPGLMFEVLPIAFAKMGGGQFFGGLFFLLLLFAAWTSSISMAEPLVALLTERYNFSRLAASLIVGACAWTVGIGSVLSFNVWQNVKIFGRWNFFFANTDLVTNILLPLGGLAFAIFAGWIMSKSATRDELKFAKEWFYQTWRFLTRYLAPISILVIICCSALLL